MNFGAAVFEDEQGEGIEDGSLVVWDAIENIVGRQKSG